MGMGGVLKLSLLNGTYHEIVQVTQRFQYLVVHGSLPAGFSSAVFFKNVSSACQGQNISKLHYFTHGHM